MQFWFMYLGSFKLNQNPLCLHKNLSQYLCAQTKYIVFFEVARYSISLGPKLLMLVGRPPNYSRTSAYSLRSSVLYTHTTSFRLGTAYLGR